ncbi:2-C-methyl-D-erythritol 4-phosphate cytidylyltransferase [Weissella confusa]|uniref:IspD/TarI family cytidylyltransferase n=1 Tax=Weissella confusa TaxID=1583 RepID=UPI00108085D3|nr:2-C-methyl-D-erythritol 4-phosphate cytidylyltransferase [Weissella confusa]MBJ7635630.1 2-C-methyl-D-erythritol 4-phosphate cytidylyltransferase [Weissella confusa]TGE43044.1 2-C-methyl-D-erythritol 4-phosphate cytidylyltransferase [Weissella confusa]TGE51440.1 2-C-methyl-D-erythritol 4-phosphate cytidylyltransferase [Weissella confusa]
MIYAQVMAGGIGSRMGHTERPKQFLNLADKPIIIHTLEKFSLIAEFDKIIVSIHPKWMQYAKDLIAKYIDDERFVVIEGGAERNDTVMGAINYIKSNFGLNEADVLVMHDAVRPFVSRRIIMDNIEAASHYKAVDTVIPATDTIVKSENGIISEIPVRDQMFQGQTPQTVNIQAFESQYNSMTIEERNILSDSAKVMLLAGYEVGVVNGDESNIKVTRPYDLRIANIIAQENLDVQ